MRPRGQTEPPNPAGERPGAAAGDHHVEQLLLHRQVPLDLDHKRRASEEVSQQEPEQAVPVAEGVAITGHQAALRRAC
jgi:hypothetical protein